MICSIRLNIGKRLQEENSEVAMMKKKFSSQLDASRRQAGISAVSGVKRRSQSFERSTESSKSVLGGVIHLHYQKNFSFCRDVPGLRVRSTLSSVGSTVEVTVIS